MFITVFIFQTYLQKPPLISYYIAKINLFEFSKNILTLQNFSANIQRVIEYGLC